MTNGSLSSLWRVAWPLMLGFLSWVSMMFVDRLFIGYYSSAALNAAVNAGTFAMAATFGIDQLVRITSVFVSRRNGAGETSRLGEPVWQGIWMAFFSLTLFIPLSFWAGELIFDDSAHGLLCREYFRAFMTIGPLAGFQAALSSYFVGQGRMGIVGAAIGVGNLLNLTLDPLLIFGLGGFPELGMVGAVIATGIGTFGQVLFLFWRFIRAEERQSHGTSDWRFKPHLAKRILLLGTPPALFLLLELVGSGLFFSMLASISEEYLLVAGIHQSLFMILLFVGGGLEHGAQNLAGNLIGAGKLHELPRILRSGLILHLIYASILLLTTALFGEWIVDLFLREGANGGGAPTFSPEALLWVKKTAWIGLSWLVVRLFLETSSWLVNGILRAAGDTLFPLILGVMNIWIGLLLPTYLFLVCWGHSMWTAFLIWVAYGAFALLFSSVRFFSGSWQKKLTSVTA